MCLNLYFCTLYYELCHSLVIQGDFEYWPDFLPGFKQHPLKRHELHTVSFVLQSIRANYVPLVSSRKPDVKQKDSYTPCLHSE